MYTQAKYLRKRRILTLLMSTLAPLVAVIVMAASASAQPVPNDWRIGSIVHLSKGTQIRHGPGISFCYHTIVPEEGWAVKVIGGPRSADGRTWYDTSRREAGDPSGGTGWVNIQQADTSPAPDDGGVYCPVVEITPTPITPPGTVCEPGAIQVPTLLLNLQSWWWQQQAWAKIGLLVVAFVLLFTSNRWMPGASTILATLLRAFLWGILLAGLADLTRQYWTSNWETLVGTSAFCSLDLALVLLVAPALGFLVGMLFNLASRVVAIAISIISLLIMLSMLAPGRFNDLLGGLLGFLGQPRP